ncbi:SLBB domain-containing protein [Porticoccaceae bacterium]|nr:SLBB domain-containing protein [Porticoccaceae bacterium]
MKALKQGSSARSTDIAFLWVKGKSQFARQFCLKIALMLSFAFALELSAQAISPEMLQQFKSMPRAQQEALARQYGIDLDQMLMGQGQGETSLLAKPGEPLEQRELDDKEQSPLEDYLLFQQKFAEFQASLIEEEEEIKRYGLALFDGEVSTFAPTDDASVPDNYRLGAGDHLVVQLFGSENDQYDLQVDRSGNVSFPKLGPIMLAGLTFEDARALVEARVKDQILGARVTVSMGRLRAINLFIAGEVVVPGAYSVSALTTVTQALFQAGGISDIGSLRHIQVKRGGEQVAKFDVYDLLLKGDVRGDVRLQSGDVVFVPPVKNTVTVQGAVNRPMIYEFVQGESVADAVNMAGGLNEDGYGASISVVSKAVGDNLPTVANVNINDKRTSAKLSNGDLVTVSETTQTLKNAITLEGAVVRPGIYAWSEGQRVSDLMKSIDGDLKTYADLGYGLIVRQKNARLDIEVLQVDLGEAITQKGSTYDLLTRPRDHLIVFALPNVTDLSSVELDDKALTEDDEALLLEDEEQLTVVDELADEIAEVQREALLAPIIEKLRSQARSGEPVQIVSVSGAVKSPGTFPVTKGFTARSLIAAAGGLKDNAYLASAELRRLYQAKSSKMEAEYRDINLTGELASAGATALESRDHLHVREIPDWNPDDSILIEGEVRFPGEYRIRKGEGIASVLARAGGLTSIAFARGAVFERESVAEQETARAQDFSRSILRSAASALLTKEENSLDIASVQAIAEILQDFEGAGRLLVDVEAAISGDNLANIPVEDGDRLVIPQQTSTVTVVGEIRRPGTHSYQSGLNVQDYLGLSAGMTARADDKELYIVKANGSVVRPSASWIRFINKQAALSPGDTIVVPIDAGYTNNLTLWRDVTQVIFNSTAGLASIVAASK